MDTNKSSLVIAGLLLLGGIVVVVIFLNSGKNKGDENVTSQSVPTTLQDQKNGVGEEGFEEETGNSAEVIDYSKQVYDEAIKSDKLVVLYFYANWCPICREEFPKMQSAFNVLPADKVVGMRVNFNDSDTDSSEEALAEKFDIPYQHTKVFLKDGEVILKSLDSWDETRYIKEITSAIK
jgi:thiol-disulfide isomerase/thioredoxin